MGIEWEWQAGDGCQTKAPLGGEATGPNPTDRAKSGTKRHLLTDGRGVPLALLVAGANVNDHLLLEATLANRQAQPGLMFRFLVWLGVWHRGLCLDKAYDHQVSRETVAKHGYVGHIRTRGEEKKARKAGYRARRWVAEACHSWLNRFRKLLVRFEKTETSYLGLLHLACAITWYRKTGVLG